MNNTQLRLMGSLEMSLAISTLANELLHSLRYTENTQLIALFDAHSGFHAYYMLKLRSSCMLVCTMPILLFFLLPVLDSAHIANL